MSETGRSVHVTALSVTATDEEIPFAGSLQIAFSLVELFGKKGHSSVSIGNLTSVMTRSGQLLELVRQYRRAIVVMHDNPDPDAIATGWAVLVLLREKLQIPVSLVGGGAIVRAENRHMVDLLSPPIRLAESITYDESTAVILVDCSVGSSNHLVTRQAIQPTAVRSSDQAERQ